MIYATIVLMILYNLVVFNYARHIFHVKRPPLVAYAFAILANSLLLFVPVYIARFRFEPLIMLLYFALFAVEFALLYRQPLLRVLLGVLAFATNFFAIRVILIGIFSITRELTITQLFSEESTRLLITSLNFLVPIPYILITKKFFSNKTFDLLLNDKPNLKFSVFILFATYCSQVFNAILFLDLPGRARDITDIAISQIRCGVFTIFVFGIVMVCVLIFSRLQKSALNYNRIAAALEREHELVERLASSSNIEGDTGLFVRRVAEAKITELVLLKSDFFISFVDMDGLKVVNDKYGHEAGDFYIKQVANILATTFEGDMVARIGGDEFLVVGSSEQDAACFKLRDCAKMIEAVPAQHNKPYRFSISYGLLPVAASNTLSPRELIDIADQRMYESKQRRKRERETIEVPGSARPPTA